MAETDPFGTPSAPRPRNPIFPAFPIAVISIVSIAAVVFLSQSDRWRRLGDVLTRETPAARQTPVEREAAREAACLRLSRGARDGGPEGSCTRWSHRFQAQTRFIVVNARHELRTPDYTVTTGAEMFNGPGNGRPPAEFRDGVEQLLSVHLTVTNTTGRKLLFGGPSRVLRVPRYAPEPAMVTLILPCECGGEGEYTVLLGARRGPRPDVFGPIPPHATRSGWVTFGVPVTALRGVSEPGARLDFLPPGGRPGYTGQIRI